MVIPNWLSQNLNEKDILDIESKIITIENQSDIEIVPVIVRASSQYFEARTVLQILFNLVFLIVWVEGVSLMWFWDGYFNFIIENLYLNLIVFGIVILLTNFVVAPWFGSLTFFKKLLISKNTKLESCSMRSEIEFYQNRIYQTENKNGILVFISMLEKQVIVRGDETIRQKLDDNIWDNMVGEIIINAKKRQIASGIMNALDLIAQQLQVHFPINEKVKNELSNKLIIKD